VIELIAVSQGKAEKVVLLLSTRRLGNDMTDAGTEDLNRIRPERDPIIVLKQQAATQPAFSRIDAESLAKMSRRNYKSSFFGNR